MECGDRRTLLRCSECGTEVEILSRERHQKRPYMSLMGRPWRAVRQAMMEKDGPLPGIQVVVCPEEKCLASLAGKMSLRFRFRNAEGEEWDGRPPIEVFYPIDDEVPEGTPVFKMEMQPTEVRKLWGASD
jgi:hypothetical protein